MTVIKRLMISLTLIGMSQFSYAVPMLYTFEGTITGFTSYHSEYDITDFDITLGQTSIAYTMIVDFERDVSTYTNSAGTWDYFYSDIVSGSFMTGGTASSASTGFNFDRSSNDLGQISGVDNGGTVRIQATESMTSDWRVQDWSVGQVFNSQDLACYQGSTTTGCAVYAFGNVILTSIDTVAVSEPATLLLLLPGLLLLVRQRYKPQ